MTSQSDSNMINLTIDGKAISVPKGTTVYTATQRLGIDIPIFCYQDRMPPFGACRVCLVEVEKMGKLQTSCTLEATEGMVVKTQSDAAVSGREQILEFLLINHPLDCPICDRGGECPLQDQTQKFGPGKSRFYEDKRHFKKPIPLGPVLMLDRERCIVCARCTRFGDHVAGDHALEFIERGYRTEVGTPTGGTAESKFIGNTIMICPVGALTSQVYRFRARPWDNEPTATTCTLCPVGCSMILDQRDGEIMRTRSLENREVNDIWLCDKGWFGYEFADHPDRLLKPLIRKNDKLEESSWEEALALVAQKMKEAQPRGEIAGLGGNSLTTEENYYFQKLIRQSSSANHVDHRIGMPIYRLEDDSIAPGMEISIGDCEQLSYAILLGLDITEEFPVIWLRLKQAINKGAKVLFIGHYAPEITHHLLKAEVHAPGYEIEIIKKNLPEIAALAEEGKKGALLVGKQYLASKNRRAILSEILKLRKSTPLLSLNLLEGKGNSMGARIAGMRPDIGPLGDKIAHPGMNAIQLLENAASNGWSYLHVAGADPATHMPAKLWVNARAKIGFMVVQDLFLTETAQQADVVLPTLSYVEKEGSFINIERRIQKIRPGKAIPQDLHSDAGIFTSIGHRLNLNLSMDHTFEEILKPGRLPYEHLKFAEEKERPTEKLKEGMLYATFAPALFDHGVRMKRNTKLVQMAKQPLARIHPHNGAIMKIQNGCQIQIKTNNGAIIAKAHLDPRVAHGTIVLPLGFEEVPVHDLGPNLLNGMIVEVHPT